MFPRAVHRLVCWLMAIMHGGLAVVGVQLHHLTAVSGRIFPQPASQTCSLCSEKDFSLLSSWDWVYEPLAKGSTSGASCWDGKPAVQINLQSVGFPNTLPAGRAVGLRWARAQRSVGRSAPETACHDPALCPICQYLVQPKLAVQSLPAPSGGLLFVVCLCLWQNRLPSPSCWTYQARAPPTV